MNADRFQGKTEETDAQAAFRSRLPFAIGTLGLCVTRGRRARHLRAIPMDFTLACVPEIIGGFAGGDLAGD